MFVTFADALMLLFELADKEDSRFQPAAARWHARFVLAAGLPLRDSEMVMNLLCGIRSAPSSSLGGSQSVTASFAARFGSSAATASAVRCPDVGDAH
jgi:hypothetical protein